MTLLKLSLMVLLGLLISQTDGKKDKKKSKDKGEETTTTMEPTTTTTTIKPSTTIEEFETSTEPITTSSEGSSNYQFCLTINDLNLYNLDYHGRKSSYGKPSGTVNIFDPSTNHPSIRSFSVPLRMSTNPNITDYEYSDLNRKLCWINTRSTQLYFDFEIFQFYHVAMHVGYLINTGLNGSGYQRTSYKHSESVNITSSKSQEYGKVTVSITYEIDLKLLSDKDYSDLKTGVSMIEGSMSYSNDYFNYNYESGKGGSYDDGYEKGSFVDYDYGYNPNSNNNPSGNNPNSQLSIETNNKHHGGGSDNIGMVFSAIVAACVGFGVLIAVGIYMFKLYSRKGYIDMDKNNNNKKGNGKKNNEYYDEVEDGIKGKLKKISLKDTKKKLKNKMKKTRKSSISMNKNVEQYDSIKDVSIEENEHESDACDVSIVTNESRGLP